jgi:hypothetical protein
MPFTIDDFLEVFRRYNEAVWPVQWILVILALVAVVAALRARWLTRAPALILAVLWLWIGIVYHLAHFRAINPAAVIFGALFIVQAGVFVWLGLRKPAIRFTVRWDAPGVLGALMIVFALIIYPSLGWLAGHRYPAAPTFGLPCPTTVFTFGLLLWATSAAAPGAHHSGSLVNDRHGRRVPAWNGGRLQPSLRCTHRERRSAEERSSR